MSSKIRKVYQVFEVREAYWKRTGLYPEERIVIDTDGVELEISNSGLDPEEFNTYKEAKEYYTQRIEQTKKEYAGHTYPHSSFLLYETELEYWKEDDDEDIYINCQDLYDECVIYGEVCLTEDEDMSIQDFMEATGEEFSEYEVDEDDEEEIDEATREMIAEAKRTVQYLKLTANGKLIHVWRELSKSQKTYATQLVKDFGWTTEMALQSSFIHPFSSYIYNYKSADERQHHFYNVNSLTGEITLNDFKRTTNEQ